MAKVRQRMHEIARVRIRYGYRRVHIPLRREGWSLGRNLVYRLYRDEEPALRSKLPLQRDYNESRPHMALGNIPPAEFALQASALPDTIGFAAARN